MTFDIFGFDDAVSSPVDGYNINMRPFLHLSASQVDEEEYQNAQADALRHPRLDERPKIIRDATAFGRLYNCIAKGRRTLRRVL